MSRDPSQDPPRLLANDLISFISNPVHGWREVHPTQEAQDLANQGVVVVGGVTEPAGQGHVLVVMPGDMQRSGGFFDGVNEIPPGGLFPLALSTSSTGYVGAMSKGDKTVRDAFTRVDWKRVKFWAFQR
jgi:hypothetical protein